MYKRVSHLIVGSITAIAQLATLGFVEAQIAPTVELACCQQAPGGSTDTQLVDLALVDLALGGVYDFIIDQTSSAQPGGKWASEHGAVTASGSYTAPSYYPAGGLDTVRYEAPNGLIFKAHIRLHANQGYAVELPTILPSTFFNTANWNDPSPTPDPVLPGQTGEVAGSSGMSEQQQQQLYDQQMANLKALNPIPMDGKRHPIELQGSATENALAPLFACEAIPPVMINGVAALRVPTYMAGSPVQAFAIMANSAGIYGPVRVCRTGPLYPPPDYKGKPCSPEGGFRYVRGPLKQYVKRGPWNNNAGSIKITPELAASLWKLFKFEVAVGITITFARQSIEYTQIQNYDRYKCIKGVWTYAGSGTCKRFANGELTVPFWVAWFDGYPVDGGPRTPWGPWSCSALP